jgi:transposase
MWFTGVCHHLQTTAVAFESIAFQAAGVKGSEMAKNHLTGEKKWHIISIWKQTGSIEKTARLTKTTWPTVKRWVLRYQETGALHAKRSPGRKRLMDNAVAEQAVQLLMSTEHGSAKEAAFELHIAGMTPRILHKSTITRGVRRHGKQGGTVIIPVKGAPAKELSDDNKAKRLAFATANKRRSWKNIMFTDRKKFYFRYPGSKVRRCQWVPKGSSRRAHTVNHPLGLNVYAGITYYDITRAHIVAGTSKHKTEYVNKQGTEARNITAGEYNDVVKSTFLRDGTRLFSGSGVSSWVLQQDNDPTHRAAYAAVLEYNRRNSSSISILGDWPPNSPDLNPIENLWSWVDAQVHAMGCQTFEEFRQAVLDQLAAVPKQMLRNLISSMQERLAKVIELEGDRINY